MVENRQNKHFILQGPPKFLLNFAVHSDLRLYELGCMLWKIFLQYGAQCLQVCVCYACVRLRTPDTSSKFINRLSHVYLPFGVSGTVVADGAYSWEQEGVSLQEGIDSDPAAAGRGCSISGTGCDSGVHVAG